MTTLYTLVMVFYPIHNRGGAIHSVPNLTHATCLAAAKEFRTGEHQERAFCVEVGK